MFNTPQNTGRKRARSPTGPHTLFTSSSSSYPSPESPLLTAHQRDIRNLRLKLADILRRDLILQRNSPDYHIDFLDQTRNAESYDELMSLVPSQVSPQTTRALKHPTFLVDDVFSEEEEEDSFTDSPTDRYYPSEITTQRAHGTGVYREPQEILAYKNVYVASDIGYVDMHNIGQHYGPSVYDSQIYPSFVSLISQGYDHSKRQGNRVAMHHLSIRLQIILPEVQCTESTAGKLNDELRIIIVKDSHPNPSHPKITDVLSVHDSHHTINAFYNPVFAERFTILYDTSFFMQYTTIWEYTRGEAIKMAQFLPVDMKESIEIDLSGHTCSFNPNATGYASLVDYNIFAIFLTARGIKITSDVVSDMKEAETFKVDWSARLTFR